jgi:hypothetical protein
LREQWIEIQSDGRATPDVINAIRNRCVLPILKKLDDIAPA